VAKTLGVLLFNVSLLGVFIAALPVSGFAQTATVNDLKRRDVQSKPDPRSDLRRRFKVLLDYPPVPLGEQLDGDPPSGGRIIGSLYLIYRGAEYSFDLYSSGRLMPNTMWGDINRRFEEMPEWVRDPLQFVIWYALSQNGMVQVQQEFMQGLLGDDAMMRRAQEHARRAIELMPGGSEFLDALTVGRNLGSSGPSASAGLSGDGSAPLPAANSAGTGQGQNNERRNRGSRNQNSGSNNNNYTTDGQRGYQPREREPHGSGGNNSGNNSRGHERRDPSPTPDSGEREKSSRGSKSEGSSNTWTDRWNQTSGSSTSNGSQNTSTSSNTDPTAVFARMRSRS